MIKDMLQKQSFREKLVFKKNVRDKNSGDILTVDCKPLESDFAEANMGCSIVIVIEKTNVKLLHEEIVIDSFKITEAEYQALVIESEVLCMKHRTEIVNFVKSHLS